MSREIKFRQPVFNNDGSFSNFHYWGWLGDGHFVSPLSMGHNVKKVRGLQATGMDDNNGREIYEGDILSFTGLPEYHRKPFVIEWDIENAKYTTYSPRQEAEIIGNIYENPELLDMDND
jgi:uncharacterized phage protein (TIGR01671 family)